MVRRTFHISERQDALLRERSAQTGRSVSELVRLAFDEMYDPSHGGGHDGHQLAEALTERRPE